MYGIHLRQFHGVLNAAACPIVCKWKFDSISSTIRDVLHWLLSQQRVEYKLCTLMFNCMHGVAPIYLSTTCQPVAKNIGSRSLSLYVEIQLSQSQGQCTSSLSGTSPTAVVGLSIRNSLPVLLHDHTLTPFCRQLKTFLFSRAYSSSACSWLLSTVREGKHIVSYRIVIWRHVMSCLVMSYDVLSFHDMSSLVTSCDVTH